MTDHYLSSSDDPMIVKPEFDPTTRKLYVLVREDLPPGAQMAQAAHAFIEFGVRYPQIHRRWWVESNHICILAVPDEATLVTYYERALKKSIAVHVFCEPDLDYSYTAIAIEPGEASMKMLSELRLALSPKKKKRWFKRKKRSRRG